MANNVKKLVLLPEFALPGVDNVFNFKALPKVGFFTGTMGFAMTDLSSSSEPTVKIIKTKSVSC